MIAYEQLELDAKDKGASSKYYWTNSKCRNCDLCKSLAFNKGYKKISDHECPKCGNETLTLERE